MKNYEEQLSNSEARLRENLEQQERLAEDRRSQHQEVVCSNIALLPPKEITI